LGANKLDASLHSKQQDRNPMRWSIVFLPAFLLLAACGENASSGNPLVPSEAISDPATESRGMTPVIVMLGDSLTAGYDLPATAALPAALQREFDERGVAARFVNAGVSGETTAEGLNRYEWSVEGANADLLVVALGANDFLGNLPPEIPRRNLAAILSRAKKQDLPVALLGVTLPNETRDEREAAYAAIYPNLAAEFGVPYLPDMLRVVAGQPGLLMQDGIHPTAQGVEAMAGEIANFLVPLVEDLG
jgi:acyl-CoA thioesterase-1